MSFWRYVILSSSSILSRSSLTASAAPSSFPITLPRHVSSPHSRWRHTCWATPALTSRPNWSSTPCLSHHSGSRISKIRIRSSKILEAGLSLAVIHSLRRRLGAETRRWNMLPTTRFVCPEIYFNLFCFLNQFFYKTAPIISLNTTNQLISTDKSLMFVQVLAKF